MNPDRLVMSDAPLNHPGDEALRALSLGQLTEAELAHVSAHLIDCAECCCRIDKLATYDRLLERVQQGAACLEKALVSPAQRRSAVRALRQSHEASSAARKRKPETVPDSRIANAAAVQTHGEGPPSKGLPDDLVRFLAPPERPEEIGRLGPYRILAVLSRGGMGVVFRAHDPALDRIVALKVMMPGMAATPNARERFLREAKAAAALKHPHVVTIYQVSEDRDAPFLAMEFLEGEPLDDRIRREGWLPLADVLRIGREAALGLAAAHARGLVHRDIKPANLWLEAPTGHVKVLDFGLAWAPTGQAHLTQAGMIVGTPAYMAPEQAEGKSVDPRCDLFSLGCVLYQMITATLPFPGESAITILRAVALHEPPPVSTLRPEASLELSALVARLLAKNPEGRPASAQEVAQTLGALEQLPPRQVLPKPGARPARRSRKPLVAVAGAALAVALAVALVLWPTPRGTVRIESDDPAVEVVFDKDGPTIKGADKEPITLRAGEHGVLIKRGDFTFEADKLVLKKGAALTLRVELLPGKVQVMQDGQVVAVQDIPLPVPAKGPSAASFTNRLGMEFVRVPKGKSWLGGGNGTPGDREVAIPDDFYLGKYEVTQEEWEKVMGTNPSHFSRSGDRKDAVQHIPDEELKRFPVENVSKADMLQFLRKLNQRQQDSGWIYRLPTAVEWEYACRGGPMAGPTESTFDFYFGEATNQVRLNRANVPGASSLGRTCKVGSYQPNRLGLYDMHGNVHELCNDKVRQPAGHEEVLGRGGGYGGDTIYCRASMSSFAMPWYRANNLGLRVARVRAAAGAMSLLDNEAWLKKVRALTQQEQEKEVAARLKDLNPGFDGHVTRDIKDGVVTHFAFLTDHVTDITPLKALTGLTDLSCAGSGWNKGQLTDLEPLRGMRLTRLNLFATHVADLSPLFGMKLTSLDCSGTAVTTLEPLRGMPLEDLMCRLTPGIQTLAPLQGMPLKRLDCSGTGVSDLVPLQGMPLDSLSFSYTRVADLSPLRGMKLTTLGCKAAKATDLSVLRGMPVKYLWWDIRAERDLAILRSLKALEQINEKSAADFWKEVDGKPGERKP
jgi:formylglycine-generating enzyme required for sulfatase activity